jgi:hypothetical protein
MGKAVKIPHRPMVQIALPGFCRIEDAVDQLSRAGIEERGAVFTRREVVEFILDLVGYKIETPLHRMRLLEPSFGAGDFITVAVERLLQSYRVHHSPESNPVFELRHCLRGVELHQETFDKTRGKLESLLGKAGLTRQEAATVLDSWLVRGDFLLTEFPFQFTHIVGNPPYVRQELIPDVLMEAYRSRFHTIYDRADLYVPFIEKSLNHLEEGGSLGFICSDRWMKNRYGGPLRQLVAERFHLKYYVDMVDTPAFHTDVIAYPAITVIANEPTGPSRIVRRPSIEKKALSILAAALTGKGETAEGTVQEVENVATGAEPWILESFVELAVIRRLEETFPTLEEAGCRVGIGVATGADKVFIAPYDQLEVEPDRKLPLVTTKDLQGGTVAWQGQGIINPFGDDGGVVNLSSYPRLAAYLKQHEKLLRARHVAKRNPHGWYRTIDRIYPELAKRPKLLIPDIKGVAHIVYEDGRLYPHHNLYFITSDEWNLKALQAVLLSGIARLFVSVYSTKMRGGYLRFQAQYLRRIRIPRWRDVPDVLKSELIAAAERGDVASCNAAAYELYGLSENERSAVAGDLEQ